MLRGCLLRTTVGLLAIVWGAGVGCDYSKYERGLPIPDRALRHAQSFDPADASIAPPTTKPAVTPLPTTRSAEDLIPPPLAEVRLTLEECRQLALANNLDLKVELFNPSIAREAINQERARFEAVFTATTNYTVTDQAVATQLTGSQAKDWSSQVGVRVPFRTGGAVQLALPIDRFETNNQFSTLNPAYVSDFQASLSLPLLRGFGPQVQSQG
ncbi:MAG TPA: TolC family protein, partial [Solirubrobacterales bacterium]|nr:TolC family protein [Solirubrobacterales bacterium]